MLNRLSLATTLDHVSSELFPSLHDVIDLAWRTYQAAAQDAEFCSRVRAAHATFLVPEWSDGLCDVFSVTRTRDPYTVVAVDGSQIYPDRHMGAAHCFVINIGGATFSYAATSSVHFFSTPEVWTAQSLAAYNDAFTMSPDLVDLLREEGELTALVARADEVHDQQPVVLIDGTLIFWNLEGKHPALQKYFINRYVAQLQQLYERGVPCAGYISMPHSRDLINVVKLGLCRFATANCIPCHASYSDFPCKQVDALIDTHVMHKLLNEGERSIFFSSSSRILAEYPDHLKPQFCYFNVGSEIVRLEMPTWVAQNEALCTRVCAIILDQCAKGGGYPVSLAEAHEQAVVTTADREFFYELLERRAARESRHMIRSQKLRKKRRVGC